MFDLKKTLCTLCAENGMSGMESCAAKYACGLLKEYASDAHIDSMGNVIGTIGDDPLKPLLLLDAHIDEIGFIVTYITDDGFLVIDGVGGVDIRILCAQEVCVLGKREVCGIITSVPPHLSQAGDKAAKLSEVYVDIGMTKVQAEELIQLGDRVVIKNYPSELLNNKITSKAIDDRSGVAAILYAIDRLKGKELPYKLAVLFSSQEEMGQRGVKTAAYKIAPDKAICVDVSFALTPDENEIKCGKMSGGVMIGVSPSIDKAMSDEMIKLAKNYNIKYQLEILPGLTGTNADSIAVSRGGVKVSTLSIPIKYMHTPIEVCDISDIQAVGDLICAYIENGGGR